jgi:hypothetical protein
MKKNKIHYIKDYVIFLGVPARKLAVGLSAHSPRRLASSPPAGYPLQSLTQNNSRFYDFQKSFCTEPFSYKKF